MGHVPGNVHQTHIISTQNPFPVLCQSLSLSAEHQRAHLLGRPQFIAGQFIVANVRTQLDKTFLPGAKFLVHRHLRDIDPKLFPRI